LCGKATEWRCRALFTGQLDCTVEVLEQRAHMPLDRFVIARRHLRRKDLQRFGIGETAGQRFGDQTGIDPRLLGQGHHFGNDQSVAGHDHLVAGLGHLPRPHPTHVRHALAKHLQYRACPFKVGAIAADHDRQRTRLGPWGTARHRRIQPGHATQRRQFGSHFAGGGRLKAGEVDQQLPTAPARGDAMLTEHDLAHHGGVGQA